MAILLGALVVTSVTVAALVRIRVRAYRQVLCLDRVRSEAFAKKDALCARDGLGPMCSPYWQEKPNIETAEILREWHEEAKMCRAE